ncbi:AMP-binding protein [Flavobacterium sp.]|uniref:AMP-binding protein n=1 Tax=Flavobacterium sp. TaxID=239 RepID=UPI0040482719
MEPFHKDFKLQGKSFKKVTEIVAFSQEISTEVYLFFKDWFDEKNFVEVKTSGSTGIPKVIQLQKTHMINSALATGSFFKLPEKTTALLCMSPNFIAGKMMLVRALTLGWHLDVAEVVSNPLKDSVKQYDFSAMVPLQLKSSLADIDKVKQLIVGGGVVSKELMNEIQSVKTAIFATYGMTETITHIAVKKLNNFDSVIKSEANTSFYKVLPTISISTDQRGCLVINAPKVSNEEIITNDLVEIISDNEFNWLGRIDGVINSGGIKLIPEQIEEKLSGIISQRFFVAGIPDGFLGEKLVLIIEDESQNLSKSHNDLIAQILRQIQQLPKLEKYEKPKAIYLIPNFVETSTKKINRKESLKLIKSSD